MLQTDLTYKFIHLFYISTFHMVWASTHAIAMINFFTYPLPSNAFTVKKLWSMTLFTSLKQVYCNCWQSFISRAWLFAHVTCCWQWTILSFLSGLAVFWSSRISPLLSLMREELVISISSRQYLPIFISIKGLCFSNCIICVRSSWWGYQLF